MEYSNSLLKHFERLAETMDVRNTGPDPSGQDRESKVVPCVGELLMETPNLVFNFHPENHNTHAPGQRSFKQLITAWERAENGIEGDKHTYPEVLQLNEWASCTLRCTRRVCSEGEAVELKCEAYPFGKRKSRMHEVRTSPRYGRGNTLTLVRFLCTSSGTTTITRRVTQKVNLEQSFLESPTMEGTVSGVPAAEIPWRHRTTI
jgi:hypothetical protein